jgi:hypothetical protein
MSQNERGAGVLQEIQRVFAQRREEGAARRNFYPPEMRALVVTAIRKGYSKREVVQAAGISVNTLPNWLNATPVLKAPAARPKTARLIPAPIELRIVKNPVQVKKLQETEAPPAIARIHFRGGATLECPLSAVSAELIAALNGGAS